MNADAGIARVFAEQRALRDWVLAGSIDDATVARAQALLGPAPSDVAWRLYLDRLALYLGALLIGAGVVCFIAFNWQDLSKFAKFYGTQALLVAAVAGALWLGPQRLASRALLLLAAIVLGALFALIGQTYQTGADTWELFAAWAALMLPFALAGRWAPLWLLWAGLVNLALYLWFDSGGRFGWLHSGWFGEQMWLAVGVANLAMLALWETLGPRWLALEGRYGPRLLLMAALAPLSLGAMLAVADWESPRSVSLLAWVLALPLLFWVYRWRRVDVAALTVVALSAIAVTITALGRWLLDFGADEALAWLVLALALVGMSVGAAFWLMRLRRALAHD
jgi:uncharacterized membrane protein